MNFVEKFFEYADCLEIVTQYLLGQDWKLVSPETLAMQIWQVFDGKALSEDSANKQIQSLIWQNYAALLHDHCKQDASTYSSSQAWGELRLWLEKHTLYLVSDLLNHEDIIQETLLQVHIQLSKAPLTAPRSFLVFVLQVFRRKNIDHHRRQTAVKRGEENTVYLEDEMPDSSQDKEKDWEDRFRLPEESEDRAVENEVLNEEIRSKIRIFFRRHISSPLQLQVAEAHFLDGLSPLEIANLLNKKPHEIRMVKARVMSILRDLPPEVRADFLNILDSA